MAGVEHLEERALLLLLADRRTWEPFTLDRALDAGPVVRRQLALTLARLKDPRAMPVLVELMLDDDVETRRAAVFALGEIAEEGPGRERAAELMLRAVGDADRETGRLAVEGLAKAGVVLSDVVTRLVELPTAEILPRLLPSLFRFEDPALVRWAAQGLELDDPYLHAMAAYALSREPKPEGLPHLRHLLADPDPWVRGWAARALGQVGEREDLARLRPLLDDPEPGPIVQTLRAARRYAAEGRAVAPTTWKPRLLELMTDPRIGVRLTAIEASASWLLDPEIGDALDRATKEGPRRQRELAFLALAEAEEPRAWGLLVGFADHEDRVMRARAAEGAALLGSLEVLERLLADREASVRVAALGALLGASGEEGLRYARGGLADPDPGVRTAALEWAREHPVIAMESLLAAMAPSHRDRILDARLAGIQALAERAEAQPLERGAIVEKLEDLVKSSVFLVRRAAIRALEELGQDPPELGPVVTGRAVEAYREVVQRTAKARTVEIDTVHGQVRVRLLCPEAPLTCLNFLQLATQGFYDGLPFHRVVPDFVVQAGDPRGDGSGGPGYTIRDEMNLVRYERGTMGMALSGPDTGGSQFFITLAPQPHLDGGYTAFGRVEAGFEVLDEIVQGDLILSIREVSTGGENDG